MDYWFIQINISEENSLVSYRRYNWVCNTLKKAIKCANFEAEVFNFKPLYENNRWQKDEIYNKYCKYYYEGYITIERRHTWEKPGD